MNNLSLDLGIDLWNQCSNKFIAHVSELGFWTLHMMTPLAIFWLFASFHHVGNNFSDVLQSKRGHYGDLPVSKISELMKLGNLEVTILHPPKRKRTETLSFIDYLKCSYALRCLIYTEGLYTLTFQYCQKDSGWKNWEKEWGHSSGM